MKAFQRVALNILRIATGLLFMEHGVRKLFGWPGRAAVPANVAHSGIAGLLEFIAGLLIVIGLGTRSVSALLFIEMVWAYAHLHLRRGLFPVVNGGELAALYTVVFLFLVASGGGDFSVDGLLRRRRR